MNSAAVSLCIINYNGANHLEHAFRAIEDQAWSLAEVILIDNASDDASLEVARSLCREARIVQLGGNLGPGAARNAGFSAAKHELILFQDNDIRLCTDTIQHLVNHMSAEPQTLAVAPRVVYADDPETVQFDSADCHYLGLMATRNADRSVCGLASTPSETSSIVTACFLINRSLWRGDAPFDESFGFNLEDHDFGVRARLAGYALWVQPQARVRHGSGTPGISYRPGQIPSEQRIFYLTLNRWRVIARCYALRTLAILAPALLAFELMQFAWLATQGHFRAWWRALRAFTGQWHRLRRERRVIQRHRCVGDTEVLREAPLPMTRYARERTLARYFASLADGSLRAYWRLVRRWV